MRKILQTFDCRAGCYATADSTKVELVVGGLERHEELVGY